MLAGQTPRSNFFLVQLFMLAISIHISNFGPTKRALRQKRRELTIDPDLSVNFSTEELNTALLAVKSKKAAGFDDVYPEFIKNSGQRLKKWIVALFNEIVTSDKIPKLFKHAKFITNLKPGNNSSDPSQFRPISLLSFVFKIFERMILQRIQHLIDEFVPRSCTEKVLALTSHIEAGFQRKLKTGMVFIDFTAAYDTLWTDGSMFKFMRVVPCAKLSNLLNNMVQTVSSKSFLVIKSSRWRRLNNLDYLKEVFWCRCCAACTCPIFHQHYRTSSNMLMIMH
jgi:hypothetical protein